MFKRAFQIWYNTPGDGGSGGGAPLGAAPPPPPSTAGAGAPPPPAPPAAPTAGPVTAPAPAPGAPPPAPPQRFDYAENRSDWLSPDDVRRQIADAQRHANADAQRYRAMAEAAAGFRLPDREPEVDPQVAAARQQLEHVFPGINQLWQMRDYLSEMVGSLQRARFDPRQFAQLPDLYSSNDTNWRRHGAAALAPLHSAIAQDLGVERLTKRQSDAITRDFIAWLEEDRTGARMDRYTAADQTLGDEYLTDYRGSFIQPLQRVAGPGIPAGGRPPLPPAPRGAGVPPAPPAAPARAKTLDEAVDDAYTGFQQAVNAGR